jgi:HK97 family phage portal protein
MPMHKIEALERSTNNNIEQQALEFVTDTLLPWLVRWESFINFKLFTEKERKVYYVKFNVDGLLRGDEAARSSFYRTLWYIGAISPNEIREKENWNPYEGGDAYYVPKNMVPVSGLTGHGTASEKNDAGGEKDEKTASAI